MKFDERGFELPDGTPLALPVGATEPETLEQLMARMVQRELSHMAGQAGHETFEESNDFDIEDEDLVLALTDHELVGLEDEVPNALRGNFDGSGTGEPGDGDGRRVVVADVADERGDASAVGGSADAGKGVDAAPPAKPGAGK